MSAVNSHLPGGVFNACVSCTLLLDTLYGIGPNTTLQTLKGGKSLIGEEVIRHRRVEWTLELGKPQSSVSTLDSLVEGHLQAGASEFTRTTALKGAPMQRPELHSTEQPITLTIPGTAHFLGLSVNTVRGLLENGALGYVRVGRRVLIPRQSAQTWLEQNVVKGGVQ